jgi:hypothetical protein
MGGSGNTPFARKAGAKANDTLVGSAAPWICSRACSGGVLFGRHYDWRSMAARDSFHDGMLGIERLLPDSQTTVIAAGLRRRL